MNAISEQRVRPPLTLERVREREQVLAAMRAYSLVHIKAIRGWLHDGPKAAIWSLLDGQALDGVSGDVMEIGVFEGRTFGLLMASLGDEERAIAVDPFGLDQRRNAFLGNMRKLKVDDTRMSLWDMTSEEFSRTPERAALAGRVRFLSLDGGHGYDDVSIDLKISEDVINTDGIVAFDDFFNPWYPEVTGALFDYLAGPASLVPFAIAVTVGPPSRGANKLFLCRSAAIDGNRAMLRRAVGKNLRKERVWQGVNVDVYDFEKGTFKFDPLLMITPARA